MSKNLKEPEIVNCMNQEMLERAMLLRQQSEEAERQMEFVMQQIGEMTAFKESLDRFDASKETEILVPLGRGIYTKAHRKDEKKVFVEVGAGVVIKKEVGETIEVIENQIIKFKEVRVKLSEQLQEYAENFQEMLEEVQRMKNESE